MEYQSIISSNGSFRRVRIERRTRDRVDIELRIEPIDIEGTAEGPSGELDRSEADSKYSVGGLTPRAVEH